MGFHVSCDYCGDPVVGYFATLDLGGRYNDRHGNIIDRDRLYFHPGDGEHDETSCLAQVQRMLGDMVRWAHREGGSGYVWRLMEPGPVTDPDGGTPVGEDWQRRVGNGTALHKLDLPHKAAHGLRAANLVTLEEVAGRTEEDIRTISGVGPTSLRRIKAEMERRGLTFREDRKAVS